MQYFGVDETKPGLPFVRVFSPTEFDKLVGSMIQRVKDYHPGIDLLNPGLWVELGYEGGALQDYLRHVMDIERTTKTSMTAQNAPEFNTKILETYGGNPAHLLDFSRAYTESLAAGEVPMAIQQPWDYQATSAAQDIGSGVAAGAKSLGPLILGAVAVYALASAFLPNLVGNLVRGK